MAAKKWDMAAAIASHLVKVEPENAAWWISLAYSIRRSESVEKAEAILLRASVTAAWKRRKRGSEMQSLLIKRLAD
jgi:hypothetical protein